MAAKVRSISPVTEYGARASRRPSSSAVREGISASLAMRVHMSPPMTPASAQDATEHEPPRALFHNYLRAFHPFDPSITDLGGEDGLLMTASMKSGDLILIHSVHANGWADGTVLSTGERGWLPTNFCEAYDHPHLRNLLNAMTQFWDLLGANEDANLSAFVRQDYIRGLIAGVRYLLEHADCLHRDAPLVQRSTGIRRMRKGLLADLSGLVQIAKNLQETISGSYNGDVIHFQLEDLIGKAFKVVTRAVGFLDIWAKETADATSVGNDHSAHRRSLAAPFTASSLVIDTEASTRTTVPRPIDSAKHFSPIAELSAAAGAERSEEKHSPRRAATIRSHRATLAHRLSLINAEDVPSNGLASTQLSKAHDRCIGYIGAFIGHHLQSRSSPELIDTTERVVGSCNSLLAVVEKIRAHDVQRSTTLHHASIDVQAKLEELVRATRDVFTFSDAEDGEVVMLPEQTTRLVAVGTGLIRMTGDCVNKARSLIEQIGDSELEQPSPPKNMPSSYMLQTAESPRKDSPRKTRPPSVQSITRSMTSFEKRLSRKMLPALPADGPPLGGNSDRRDFAKDAASVTTSGPVTETQTPLSAEALSALATPSMLRRSAIRKSVHAINGSALRSPIPPESDTADRKNSVGMSIAGSTETYRSSMRNSGNSAVSAVSTRATTPERSKDPGSPDPVLLNSFTSMSSMRSGITDAEGEVESQLLQKTFASELTLNKEGQVTGGSLPALVEQLTIHDAAPDQQFVSAFYLTFRMFTTPRELALALIERFDYVGDSKAVGIPVKLRIYNVFKGWLETYWNTNVDKIALGDIRYFALHKLKPNLPSAGERLLELTRKVTSGYYTGNLSGPLVSGVGKSSLSIAAMNGTGANAPEPVVSRSQLQSLQRAAKGGSNCNILEFDAGELARQLTLITSRTFCDIQPEELLSLDWGKRGTEKARNVRAMCTINTDLAHVVGDTILSPDDAKKRAAVIKHWSKVGHRCLELNNYDSLVAIMCSINSSVVSRLRRTWEVVSKNTKDRLGELNGVIDLSRNQSALRKRFETQTAPCIPFLGIYLTDLTFLDAGNPKTRELPNATSEDRRAVSVINFDKHMRMAKIVSHLQKFQVPYHLTAVPEMQFWMEANMSRMRASNDEMVSNFHRRSLLVEPRLERTEGSKATESKRLDAGSNEDRPRAANKDRLESFLKGGARLSAQQETPIGDAALETRP